jgi:hypothetical protein
MGIFKSIYKENSCERNTRYVGGGEAHVRKRKRLINKGEDTYQGEGREWRSV